MCRIKWDSYETNQHDFWYPFFENHIQEFEKMETEESNIRSRIAELYRALTEHDRDAAARLLHERFIYLAPWGKIYTKKEYLDRSFSPKDNWEFLEDPKFLSLEIITLIATTVSLELRGKIVIDGETFQGSFRASHTLVKTEGNWLFLACYIEPI
jgi:hypothetical protein